MQSNCQRREAIWMIFFLNYKMIYVWTIKKQWMREYYQERKRTQSKNQSIRTGRMKVISRKRLDSNDCGGKTGLRLSWLRTRFPNSSKTVIISSPPIRSMISFAPYTWKRSYWPTGLQLLLHPDENVWF